jgi:hypothetical protein
MLQLATHSFLANGDKSIREGYWSLACSNAQAIGFADGRPEMVVTFRRDDRSRVRRMPDRATYF